MSATTGGSEGQQVQSGLFGEGELAAGVARAKPAGADSAPRVMSPQRSQVELRPVDLESLLAHDQRPGRPRHPNRCQRQSIDFRTIRRARPRPRNYRRQTALSSPLVRSCIYPTATSAMRLAPAVSSSPRLKTEACCATRSGFPDIALAANLPQHPSRVRGGVFRGARRRCRPRGHAALAHIPSHSQIKEFS